MHAMAATCGSQQGKTAQLQHSTSHPISLSTSSIEEHNEVLKCCLAGYFSKSAGPTPSQLHANEATSSHSSLKPSKLQ
jgi:hypothetical protein